MPRFSRVPCPALPCPRSPRVSSDAEPYAAFLHIFSCRIMSIAACYLGGGSRYSKCVCPLLSPHSPSPCILSPSKHHTRFFSKKRENPSSCADDSLFLLANSSSISAGATLSFVLITIILLVSPRGESSKSAIEAEISVRPPPPTPTPHAPPHTPTPNERAPFLCIPPAM